MKKLMYVFVCLLLCFTAGAQELNARVTINSDKVQGTNKQVFTTLQTAKLKLNFTPITALYG